MLLAALLIHFFLPHESNNQRARVLHPIFIAVLLLLFLGSQIAMASLSQYVPVVLGYSANISREEIVRLTNAEREKAGLGELVESEVLDGAAAAKAEDMFAKDYWAHTSPDGIEPWKFFMDSGYKYRFAGENLARDFSDAPSVVKAWMASRTHRENLLSSRYQDIGIAVMQGELNGVQTTLVVQFFGSGMTPLVLSEEPARGEARQERQKLVTPPPLTVAGTSQPVAGLATPKSVLLSPFATTKNIAIFMVSLFFLVLSLDMIIVKHQNIERVSSRSFAHFIFYGAVLVAIYLSRQGLIL